MVEEGPPRVGAGETLRRGPRKRGQASTLARDASRAGWRQVGTLARRRRALRRCADKESDEPPYYGAIMARWTKPSVEALVVWLSRASGRSGRPTRRFARRSMSWAQPRSPSARSVVAGLPERLLYSLGASVAARTPPSSMMRTQEAPISSVSGVFGAKITAADLRTVGRTDGMSGSFGVSGKLKEEKH